jgi:hypothetical protein
VFRIEIPNSINIIYRPSNNTNNTIDNPTIAIGTYLDEACTQPFINNSWGTFESSEYHTRTSKYFYLKNTGNVEVKVTFHIDGLVWNETYYPQEDILEYAYMGYGLWIRLYERNTVWAPVESQYCTPRTLKPNEIIQLQLMLDILPYAPTGNVNFTMIFYANQ